MSGRPGVDGMILILNHVQTEAVYRGLVSNLCWLLMHCDGTDHWPALSVGSISVDLNICGH